MFLALLLVPALGLPSLGGTARAPERAHPPAAPAGRIECSSVPSKILSRSVRFCALLPPAYDAQPTSRFPVLYWLHGLGQNEQSFVSSGGSTLVDDLRTRGAVGDFILLTPDGGRSFYLNSHDNRVRYEDFFIREFLPAMERRYRIQAARTTRGISGVSMGGFGALHFGLKYPETFGSVSAHSAAVMQEPPAAMTNGARMGFLEEVFGMPLDRPFWDRQSLFTLAHHAPPGESWKIYFDCGTEDDFGFEEGNQALDRALTTRGIRHEFHLYPGNHGWGYFAKHLPASLEFHWKAFAVAESASQPKK
ncbi:MAG TPA: alpha/beta hydrolase family protein [Candidatus Acidoferrales bacterium]|nr:alpha/beta hydrolase family protein [Candidatus Acidoferrales bacterium]